MFNKLIHSLGKLVAFLLEILKRLPYFLITIVFFGSLGVTIPIAIDYFKNKEFTPYSLFITPNNLITYSLSIFLVSLIDRFIFLLKKDRYKHKVAEFLFLVIGAIVQSLLVFLAMLNIYHQNFWLALQFSFFITGLSYINWWIVKKKDKDIDPYSALGGNIS